MWDKAFLINLDYRKDRLELTRLELAKWGIEFERYSANTAKIGKDGCRLSHIGVLKKSLSENVSPLIIEDDIIISNDYTNSFEYVQSLEKIDDWDCFFYYCDHLHSPVRINSWVLLGPTFCTHFYIVNKNSISKVLKVLEGGTRNLDDAFISARKELHIYCASRNLVFQNTGIKSDISGRTRRNGEMGGLFINKI